MHSVLVGVVATALTHLVGAEPFSFQYWMVLLACIASYALGLDFNQSTDKEEEKE